MENALKLFKERIEFIGRQIHTQGLTQGFIKSLMSVEMPEGEKNNLKEILSNTTDEKVYQYTANVISLYGGLECFVEELIEEYLIEVSSLYPSYKKMVEKVGMTEYLLNGISLINHAEERKFKNLPKTDVLKSLYETIVNDKSSTVKSEAYIDAGGGNYKHDAIMKCFSQLGMKEISGSLKKFDPLYSYIQSKGITNSESAVFTKVDDLVIRRNELAHGSGNIETLDADVFKEYLSFLSLYTETINNYLDNEIKRHKWIMSPSVEITPRVYKDNVVVLRGDDVSVGAEYSKGQKVLIGRGGKYYGGEIANIKVEDKDLENYKKEEKDIEIGIKITSICTITKECKLKFL